MGAVRHGEGWPDGRDLEHPGRTALLRALLAPAQNILLDEPFTGLDDAALEQAMRFTKQQVQNRTLILATHNPVTAEFFGGPVLHLSGT